MPDSLARHHPWTSTSDLIRRKRRPLPPPEPNAGNWRAWAATVCQAEVEHARDDFWRAVHELGLAGLHDRDDGCGGHDAALSWLSHLQAHESDKRGPWAAVRWHTALRRTA